MIVLSTKVTLNRPNYVFEMAWNKCITTRAFWILVLD